MDEVSLTIRRARRGNQTSLEISNRNISNWPQDLFKIKSLEKLNLSGNSLTQIPGSIQELENLVHLDLSCNSISSISQEILSLPNLEFLNLEGNPINLGVLSGPSLKGQLSEYLGTSLPEPRKPSEFPKHFKEENKQTENVKSAVVKNAYKGVTEIDYEELELGEIVSQGGFSVVHKGSWRGSPVAVKVIVDPIITPELQEEFENEISMLGYLRHPNTVLLMSICSRPHLTIVTDFAEQGSLFDLLHKSREAVPEETKLRIATQIARVFMFYHQSGVVHRDLKTMNVLLDNSHNVKICDFGLARFKTELNKGSMQFSGTPSYMAPELFRKQAYDEKVDVFAFGTVLWEIMSREVPYDGLEPAGIREKILGGNYKLDMPIPVSRKYSTLIEECRSSEPRSRPSFAEILERLSN